jgi:hypothetical protein
LNDGRVRRGNPSHLRVVGQTLSAHDEQQALNLVFAALSDPVRREILDQLDGHDLLVSEVAAHYLYFVAGRLAPHPGSGTCRIGGSGAHGPDQPLPVRRGPIYGATLWLNRYSKYWQFHKGTQATSGQANRVNAAPRTQASWL